MSLGDEKISEDPREFKRQTRIRSQLSAEVENLLRKTREGELITV